MLTIRLETVDSTSRFLTQYLSHYKNAEPIVCITKRQTSGYGQYGRNWVSQSRSLAFTLALPLSSNQVVESWFSLSIAYQIYNALISHQAEPLKIKWPNDIYHNDGKVSGCLIEIIKTAEGLRFLNIGIGINLSAIEDSEGFKASFVSIDNVEHFLDDLISKLNSPDLFDKQQLLNIKTVDYFSVGQDVIVYDCDLPWPGVYLGLSPDGIPMINVNGTQKLFNSGRTSIRPA